MSFIRIESRRRIIIYTSYEDILIYMANMCLTNELNGVYDSYKRIVTCLFTFFLKKYGYGTNFHILSSYRSKQGR
ncbi:hypothetical protein PspKH34_28990 [Parageobacillus sp. KH3-4]|nr:hypothetical protein PspKH34_28990 [Parageobacillus sp. KH3-4]